MTNQTISGLPPVTGLSGAERIVVDQDDLLGNTGTFNATVVQLIALVQMRLGYVPGSVSQKQLRQALVDLAAGTIPGLAAVANAIYSVSIAINPDFANPANISWNGGGMVVPGDSLANLVQSTLGLSSGQMQTLLNWAITRPF